jgi:hypothetical protein
MSNSSFIEALDQFKEDWAHAWEDGKLQASDYVKIVANACATLESILRSIGTQDARFEELVADCERLVQTYVVPINLNQKFKVPVMMERFFIDPQLVTTVRPMLEAMRAKVLETV